jgi:hypothetical protein
MVRDGASRLLTMRLSDMTWQRHISGLILRSGLLGRVSKDGREHSCSQNKIAATVRAKTFNAPSP